VSTRRRRTAITAVTVSSAIVVGMGVISFEVAVLNAL